MAEDRLSGTRRQNAATQAIVRAREAIDGSFHVSATYSRIEESIMGDEEESKVQESVSVVVVVNECQSQRWRGWEMQ